jgi:hypothetical protein
MPPGQLKIKKSTGVEILKVFNQNSIVYSKILQIGDGGVTR